MYNIGESIDAVYVHSNPYGSSAGNLKVFIPTLMPLITMGSPRVTPVSLNKSCYANASDCRPAVASSISTQNYITAMAPYNPYEKPYYRYGDNVKVIAKTSDFRTCRLSPEDMDNSVELADLIDILGGDISVN